MKHKACRLCFSKVELFSEANGKQFFRCQTCDAIQLDSSYFLNPEDEEKRYKNHNNDVHDSGYQTFVRPIVNAVKNDFKNKAVGLDFGCGTGPVIAKLLAERGFNITLYDPFFENNKSILETTYDFIVCCEVMEHFHNPNKEFETLSGLLKKDGKLYCKTNLYKDHLNFEDWWYKNDPTHVFFYTEKTLVWISEYFNFKRLDVGAKNVCLSK